MSTSASIDLQIASTRKYFAHDIILELARAGWCFNDYSGSSYVLEDAEFDWQTREIEPENLLSILAESEGSGNDFLFGVAMTWQDTMIGGTFLFYRSGVILFSVTINRRKIVDTPFTDYSWYIQKIVPFIQIVGQIESYECVEVL